MNELRLLLEDFPDDELARAHAVVLGEMVVRFGLQFVLGGLVAQCHALAAQSLEGAEVVGWEGVESTERPL